MRFRIAAAAAMVALALTACEKPKDDSAPAPAPAPTAAPLAQEVRAALPDWSGNAYGKYAGTLSKPTDAKVLATFTGTNAGNTLDNPRIYKPNTVGDGMQVRYTCNPTLLIGGRDYILFKVGVLDAAGNPHALQFSEVPASRTSDSWFFNFDWVSTVDLKTGNPKPYLSVIGDCKWEINILRFPKQPQPGQ
jgi:hypothetical protein